MIINFFMLTVKLRRGGFALGLPRYHKRKDIVNMYQKTAINMRLAKIQAKIYDLESLAFETTEEVNQLLNEICELVAVRYREAKIQEKKSHNLYCVEPIKFPKNGEHVDLTQATAATIEAIQKSIKEQEEIAKKIKGKKK